MNNTARARTCVGFGDLTGKCSNVAGGRWSPYFCPSCDEARMAHLDAQLKKVADSFGERRS